MWHWIWLVSLVVSVNVSLLGFIVFITYVSGQDVISLIPRILDNIASLSGSVRMQALLKRKTQLEEQVITEVLHQSASVNRRSSSDESNLETMTATQALKALNPPPLVSRWTSESDIHISVRLDQTIRAFAKTQLRQKQLRILKFNAAISAAYTRYAVGLVITVWAVVLAVISALPELVDHSIAKAQSKLLNTNWRIALTSIMAVVFLISVAIRSGKRPFTASITTFFPLLYFSLVYLSNEWASVGISIAAVAALGRAVVAYYARKKTVPVVVAKEAPESIRFLIHGEEYFPALSKALDSAEKMIFISGWWLAPEIRLRDGRADDTLISLLRDVRKRRPSLQIYVIVYNEPLLAPVRVGSAFVMQSLEAAEIGAKVLRLPARLMAGSLQNTLWSNHRKIVCVDPGTENMQAFVGGIDLCFGRYDTASHDLMDYNRPYRWAGIDYWCPHEGGLNDDALSDSRTDIVDRRLVQRMPWHDVQVKLYGPIAEQVARSFASMWNSCSLRTTIFGWGELEFPSMDFARFMPKDAPTHRVLQSLPTWGSLGMLHKHEILNAYIRAIENAKEYIYIENQFFVTWNGWQWGQRLVENNIGLAIVKRIWEAILSDINAGTPGMPRAASFFLAVVMPMTPEGEIEEDSVHAIMHFQYTSIYRGRESIFGQLSLHLHHFEHKYGPTAIRIKDYVRFFSLQRVEIDHLKHWPAEVKVNAGRLTLGAVRFATLAANKFSFLRRRMSHSHSVTERPTSLAAVVSKMMHTSPDALENPLTRTSTASDTPASLTEDEDETPLFCRVAVSQIYVHTKLLIADDNLVIIGSANLNDRSMMGNRDAEIAVQLENLPQIKNLRQRLWGEFAGLSDDDPQLEPPMRGFQLLCQRAKENAKKITVIHPGTPSNKALTTFAAMRSTIANAAHDALQESAIDPPVGYIVPYPKHFLEGERLWHQSSMSERFSSFVPPYAYT